MNNFRTTLFNALEVAGVKIPRRQRSSTSIDDVFPLKSNGLEKKTNSPNEASNYTRITCRLIGMRAVLNSFRYSSIS